MLVSFEKKVASEVQVQWLSKDHLIFFFNFWVDSLPRRFMCGDLKKRLPGNSMFHPSKAESTMFEIFSNGVAPKETVEWRKKNYACLYESRNIGGKNIFLKIFLIEFTSPWNIVSFKNLTTIIILSILFDTASQSRWPPIIRSN